MNLVDIYEYKVTPAIVDFTRHLSLINVIKILLDTAELHASKRGFGFDDMIAKNKTWVLSRFRIDLLKRPSLNDNIKIETWPFNVEKLTSERKFNILNENGELYGSASSQWFQIDFTKRRPISLENEKQYIITDVNKYCISPSPVKITEAEGVPVSKEIFTVKYSDIDINGHLTTNKYIEKVINMFDIELFKNKTIKTFEINFSKEILEGKQGEVALYKNDDDNFYCSVFSENVLCFKCKIRWE